MASERFRVIRIENLNPDVPDDEIRDSLLQLFSSFKFVSVRVIGAPTKDRVAYAIFRYVEDAEEAYESHKDMLLHGKNAIVSEVFLDDPVMDVLSSGKKGRTGPDREDNFVPRRRGSRRGFFRGRGRGGPPVFDKRPFYAKRDFRPISRILFVGGIDSRTTEHDLRRAFEPYGIVTSVDRKHSYAFVKFFTVDMSLYARRNMNGKSINGAVCRIGFGTSSPRSCLWIGRIGPWTSEEELLGKFGEFGEIEKFVWPTGKSYAYIQYGRIRHAENAYKKLQGNPVGKERKKILLEYAEESDIDSPWNYEQTPDTSDYNFDDEANWSEYDFNDEEYDNDEVSRGSSPDGYNYDRYALESRGKRDRGYNQSRMSHRPWPEDRDTVANYSSRGKRWQGRPRNRGAGRNSRNDWRDFERNDDDYHADRRDWNNSGRGGSYFERGYGQRGGRGDFRGRDRRDYRGYERDRDEGPSFERDSYGRDSFERDDHRSYERDDRRGYGRGGSRDYERDDGRGFERRDAKRSYERDERESPRQRDERESPRPGRSKNYGKPDRSLGSGRKYFRDSRSPDFKRSRRSRDRSSEHSSELPSHGAVLPDPSVQSSLYPVNPLYPTPSGSLPIYPPNPVGAYPQSSVVQVPGYPPPLQEAFQPSALSFFPAAVQSLPDFSVPPPTIRGMHGLSQEPQTSSNNVQIVSSGRKKDIASQFPVVWSGALVLKSSAFVTNMYLISGSVLLVDALLKDKAAECPVLKITQRLRLDEPDKVKEVDRRVNASGRNGCSILLAVPASAEVGDVNNIIQQRPLGSLGSYLREKSVAAVITLPPGSPAGSHTGILHAFPPCEFAHNFLRREAPELAIDYPKDDHLLVIVMRESGECA